MSLIHLRLPVPDRETLERKYYDHQDSWERALFEIHRRIRTQLMDLDVRATVKYRVKSFESYFHKLSRRSEKENGAQQVEITDLLGVRIVCPFIEDLELVEQVLYREYEMTERERKGAEFSFKEFGYESVHFLAQVPGEIAESFHLPKDTVFEIQLRTILQDAWAEVEHELVYKSEYTEFDEPLRRKLAALNANLSLADMIFHEIRVFQRELQRQIRNRRESFVEAFVESRDADGSDDAPFAADGGGTAEKPGAAPGPAFDEDGTFPEGTYFNGDVGENLLIKALHAHNRHHYQLAIELYTRLLDEAGTSATAPIALLHRGMAYFSLAKYDDAHRDFDSAVSMGVDLKRAHHYRGISFSRRGNDKAALEDFSASLAIDRFQFEVLLSRGQTYYRLGALENALADCDAALKISPSSHQAKRFHQFITEQMGM